MELEMLCGQDKDSAPGVSTQWILVDPDDWG